MDQPTEKAYRISVPGLFIRILEKPDPRQPDGKLMLFDIDFNPFKLFLMLLMVSILLSFIFGDVSVTSSINFLTNDHVQ